MAKVVLSPEALDDIKSIYNYIANDSSERAAIFIERLIDTIDTLSEFPLRGRIIPEIEREHCREVIYGSYRIMYEIRGEMILISGIIHSARDWKIESE